jgi:hypothetical protein
MNIKQAATGIQHMDEYLNEASAATVLWDVGVLLGRIAAQGEEIERLRENNNQLRGALQEVRIWLHSAGRRPEECHNMSVIDDALRAALKEGT